MLTGPSTPAAIALGRSHDQTSDGARHGARCRRHSRRDSGVRPAPPGDALDMLARRGLRPSLARPDLPFPSDISVEAADALAVCECGPGRTFIEEGLPAQHPQLV